MQITLFTPWQVAMWLLAVLMFALISRRSLGNPRCHGFYRLFAFVASAGVVIPNLRYWHTDMFAPHQLVSWLLLFAALPLLLNGLHLLRTRGGHRQQVPRENFAFENTDTLVESGVFRFIRHPMYSALMLLTWGVWLKQASWLGLVLAAATTLSLWLTAKFEERENRQFFGEAYQEYSDRTRSFIPWLF